MFRGYRLLRNLTLFSWFYNDKNPISEKIRFINNKTNLYTGRDPGFRAKHREYKSPLGSDKDIPVDLVISYGGNLYMVSDNKLIITDWRDPKHTTDIIHLNNKIEHMASYENMLYILTTTYLDKKKKLYKYDMITKELKIENDNFFSDSKTKFSVMNQDILYFEGDISSKSLYSSKFSNLLGSREMVLDHFFTGTIHNVGHVNYTNANINIISQEIS